MSIKGTIIEVGEYDDVKMQRYIVVKENTTKFPQSAVFRLQWIIAKEFDFKVGDNITVHFLLHAFTLRDGRFANTLDAVCVYSNDDIQPSDNQQITDITPDEEIINK